MRLSSPANETLLNYIHTTFMLNIEFVFIIVLHRLSWFMVLNTTFNNITVISWRSVLLMQEIGVPAENHRPAASY